MDSLSQTTIEDKGLVKLSRILGSVVCTDKAIQCLDLIGHYGCMGDSNLSKDCQHDFIGDSSCTASNSDVTLLL